MAMSYTAGELRRELALDYRADMSAVDRLLSIRERKFREGHASGLRAALTKIDVLCRTGSHQRVTEPRSVEEILQEVLG